MHSEDTRVITVSGAGKQYGGIKSPGKLILSLLLNSNSSSLKNSTDDWALQPITLQLSRGEVLGVIGRNGAGKSTLLKLIAGTLEPTCGQIIRHGRVAALLELGAGFNPEFTGRENIYFNASLIGMSTKEIDTHISDIIEFSGIKQHIEKQVKTYSSGMYVRLAFAIATSIQPDLLIIDEALSVGDGEFASKSFERIMELKAKGVAIVFCSHSMYQVQALSTRAMWIDSGRLCAAGSAIDVITSYEETQSHASYEKNTTTIKTFDTINEFDAYPDSVKITSIDVEVDGSSQQPCIVHSGVSNVSITVSYKASKDVTKLNVATGFVFPDGRIVSSVATHFSSSVLNVPSNGLGQVTVVFPKLSLLKGVYWIGAYLFCRQGIHVYDRVHQGTKIVVTQNSLEQGIVKLPHKWITD